MFITALAYLAAAGVLAMWLAWAGLRRATGRGQAPGRMRIQLIVLAAMAGLAALIWFAFSLTGKVEFDRPVMLLLTLIALPIFVLGARSLQQLGPARRWASVYLRVLVLVVLVALLAGFRTVQTHDELTVVTLIDTSESVRKFFNPPNDADGNRQDYEQWLASYLNKAGAGKPTNDYWALQTFDGKPTVRLSPSRGEVSLPPGVIKGLYNGSNARRAIDSGMTAKQQADSALRMLLVSDGNLDGEVIKAVQAAAAAGVKIDVLPLIYKVRGEVMVKAVRAPPVLRKGQSAPVTVELRSADKVGGYLELKHNDEQLDLNGDAEGTGLRIEAGEWKTREDSAQADAKDDAGLYLMTILIHRPITKAGINTFDAVFKPDKGSGLANDITSNDKGRAFTLVGGPGRVLLVDGYGGDAGQILHKALASRGIDVGRRPVTVGGLPTRLADMRKFDAILFHNVAADRVAPRTQENLARYVNDLGGGFVMIGGPDSFGAGGWTNTVIDKYILPVHCQVPLQKFQPSGALILVIDRSGSMSSPVAGSSFKQQNVAAEAAVLALKTLYPQDMIGVVSFDSSAKWIVEPQMNENPKQIAEKIRAIGSGGGTNIASGVEAAYQALAKLTLQDAAIKHMIVITDGQGRFPDPQDLAPRLKKNKITISTIGVGDRHNRQALSTLARIGKGNYHPVNNPKKLPQVFIKEARAIRRNLIKEAKIQPKVRPVASPIMKGIGQVPLLRGIVRTGAKKDPKIFLPIVADEGEPIFAHHQVGLGRAAAFTADATNLWAPDWLGPWSSSSNYADFWARTVRVIARPAASTQADLSANIQGDNLVVRLDAAGDTDFTGEPGSADFGNNLDVRGSIEGPEGKVTQVRLEQVGPGIYEARMPARQAGNYIVDLLMIGSKGGQRRVIGGTSKPAGGELRNFQSNLALLKRIAKMTDGRVLDPADPVAAKLYDRTEPIESTSTRPLRWQLMPLLLLFLLMDVACRRIAWEGKEVAAWAGGRVNAVLGIMTPRKVETGNTMTALKAKRQQTTDQLNTQGGVKQADADRGEAPGAGRPRTPAAQPGTKPPAPTKKRKFVASADDLKNAKGDFSEAVGGANKDAKPSAAATAAKEAAQTPEDQGPTTSRLLDAKRRAQQRLKDQEQ